MTRATLRISVKVTQKVKGQSHRPTNADTQNVPYLPNAKFEELQSWCTNGGRRPASASSAITSKVKSQGHKLTSAVRLISAFLNSGNKMMHICH